jgi:hypothetical protein
MSCCSSNNVNCCTNPCGVATTNTAACESLPSALDNFISHFWGELIKTEVGGVVTWSEPCGLTVGLQNNPRLADEGLACYFLRLFEDGIIGATGPQGPPGDDGANGANSYTVTLQSFTQPTSGAPNFSVKCYANPAILVGGVIFIGLSGWHTISAIGGDGTLFCVLLHALPGAPATIPAGRVVTMTGPEGPTGATGATGATGPVGPQGPAGDEFTPDNNFFVCTGADHSLTLLDAEVQFGGTEPQVTLAVDNAEYLVELIVGVEMDPTAAASPGETITLKLWDATAGAYIAAAEQVVQCFDPSQRGQIVMRAIVTTANPNTTLQLWASISVAAKGVIEPDRTSLSYVRLS